MNLVIRKAIESDAKQLYPLINIIMSEKNSYFSNSLNFTKSEYESFLKTSNRKSVTFVALNNDIIIGWAFLLKKRYFCAHVADLSIGVMSSFRNKGIGKQMITIIERDAVNYGIEKIEVYTWANNTHALNFFRNLLYNEEGYKHKAFKVSGKYENEVILSKTIKSSYVNN